MSFITKRERVFNEYDLYDLPSRNEGKLKAYASCTDARAWSHFGSDKTEHLVEIIKRNNESCRPKYVPTDVIVNTLMVAKNAEIGRLKRKIEDFEQMLVVYDQLDLTCDQKCEIANAHAAIKAANKELDDLCLDLDLSGYTEGIDSEAFETGKSRGDEISRSTTETSKSMDDETGKSRGDEWNFLKKPSKLETKSNQVGQSCTCDASTIAYDARIEELQSTIINKDAKLNAMKNTVAVLENDVCEPYYIYAHINTALEKIFGILCQNFKYKKYLDLLTAGKDTRPIDIRGKILFKMKVLEKFSLALVAPCSQDYDTSQQDCSCKSTEHTYIHVETTFALTAAESNYPTLDNKRAQLVADIMDNQEMKEILSKESLPCQDHEDEIFSFDNNSIDKENLNRLKNLQANYDDLLTCYENLKFERDSLSARCHKLTNLESECECMQSRLREYNQLWNEKEYFRKRSEDLDKLKETYYILSEETSNLETKLKAESEINKIKSENISSLREENIMLDKKLNETSLAFEKEKNVLSCKLKECECKIMCQDQQIRSLSMQMDKLLDQECNKMPTNEEVSQTIDLINEIETQKEQIKNLTHACFCNEEEKNYIQQDFEQKLKLINELKMEVESWKSKYQNAHEANEFLQKYSEECQAQINQLQDRNQSLSENIEKKSYAVENLLAVIKNKSQEINDLIDKNEQKEIENNELLNQIHKIRRQFDESRTSFDDEKKIAIDSLEMCRRLSKELLEYVSNYDNTDQENKKSKPDKIIDNLNSAEQNVFNSDFLKEIRFLRDENIGTIQTLKDSNDHYKRSLKLTKQESVILKNKLQNLEKRTSEYESLRESYEKLAKEKKSLEHILFTQTNDINNLRDSFHVTKKKSENLLDRLNYSENVKEDYEQLNKSLENDIKNKNEEIQCLANSLEKLKLENVQLLFKCEQMENLELLLSNLKDDYEKILAEKSNLQKDNENKIDEFHKLYNDLERKIEQNKELENQIEILRVRERSADNNVATLKTENEIIQTNLEAIKKDSFAILNKLCDYTNLESELNCLKEAYKITQTENSKLKQSFDKQQENLIKIEQENREVRGQSKNLLARNESLEKVLEHTHKEILSEADSNHHFYLSVKDEIENMKRQKNIDQEKIRKLMDRIDNSEYIISKLTDDVLARDNKISVLQNHINALKNEIQKLHGSLSEVVETGEQIKAYSYEKIDHSVKNIEAHYSKASDNMKCELAKLKEKNVLLENQLSRTKSKTEESLLNKHKYLSQLEHLQHERETIINEIRLLEINTVGESILNLPNSTIEDIVESLDRIDKCFDSRSISLKKTLLGVQNSYQLLKSKADEAKSIAEKEKQKILEEKEEVKREREIVKTQLENLKMQLKDQELSYEQIIEDLEAKILNQQLIFDKINQSNKDHIDKLKENISSLQILYDNAIKKLKEFQQKVDNMAEEKTKCKEIVENIQKNFEEKSKEVEDLTKHLSEIENKMTQDIGLQGTILAHQENKCVQTEVQQIIEPEFKTIEQDKEKIQSEWYPTTSEIMAENNFNPSDLITNDMPRSVNEVQILTAKVEPNLDFLKNTYLDYRIKKLSLGKLEQYSYSSLTHVIQSDDGNILVPSNNLLSDSSDLVSDKNLILNTTALIDIYKTQNYDNTSKAYNVAAKQEQSSQNSDFAIITSNESQNNIFKDYRLHAENRESTVNEASVNSTDKDLFLIYTDSENIYDDKKEFFDEVSIFAVNEIPKVRNDVNREKLNDNNEKQKLKIRLPRISIDCPSIVATSIDDKRSLDSYNTLAIYASQGPTPHSDTNIISRDSISKKISLTTISFDDGNIKPKLNNEQKHGDLDKEVLQPLNKSKTLINLSETRNKYEQKANKLKVSAQKRKSVKSNFNPKQKPYSFIDSQHDLTRNSANMYFIENTPDTTVKTNTVAHDSTIKEPYGQNYALTSASANIDSYNVTNLLRKSRSDETCYSTSESNQSKKHSPSKMSSAENKSLNTQISTKSYNECGILVKLDAIEEYENKINRLTKALEMIETDYKKKIEAVKIQYDSNVKSIINEHNQGVVSIQSLHEETLNDIIKIHDAEMENLRTMSIDAMRKAEKLEKENYSLRTKIQDCKSLGSEEEPTIMVSTEFKRKRCRNRVDTKMLTKTNVEAHNVKPLQKAHGPCTCSLDVNISDTIRNIFEQVDVDQRKLAEQAYIKYIANKLLNYNIEKLDVQELSFLHLKVCRLWKSKLNKEEALQIKINSLESELMNKQRQAQKHIADLDRKVAEERRRLQEVREAVCRNSPSESRDTSPVPPDTSTAEKDECKCTNLAVDKIHSAGDLAPAMPTAGIQPRRGKQESSRAVLAQLDVEERRLKQAYNNEAPTRLRRSHDRQYRHYKK